MSNNNAKAEKPTLQNQRKKPKFKSNPKKPKNRSKKRSKEGSAYPMLVQNALHKSLGGWPKKKAAMKITTSLPHQEKPVRHLLTSQPAVSVCLWKQEQAGAGREEVVYPQLRGESHTLTARIVTSYARSLKLSSTPWQWGFRGKVLGTKGDHEQCSLGMQKVFVNKSE